MRQWPVVRLGALRQDLFGIPKKNVQNLCDTKSCKIQQDEITFNNTFFSS